MQLLIFRQKKLVIQGIFKNSNTLLMLLRLRDILDFQVIFMFCQNIVNPNKILSENKFETRFSEEFSISRLYYECLRGTL